MERYDITIQMYSADASGTQYVWEKVPAEEGDFVLYTDAQATIAALQAKVSELQGIADEKCRCFLERAEQSEKQLTQRTAECDALKLVNDTHMKTVMKLSHVVEQRTAEFQRHDGELQQICGQALGYPWFKDDQKNFPGATEKDGVCVGEHVGITIAQELANAYRKRTAELEAAKQHHEQSENAAQLYYRELTRAKNRICEAAGLPPDSGYEPAIKHLQAELERVRGQFADLRKMVAALPKVEGEITVSHGYVKDSTRCHALFGADEDAALYAALLQHRQGMEG